MKSKNLILPIVLISILVPALVAVLYFLPHRTYHPGLNIRILPLVHAILNSTTAVLLLASLYFIKSGHRKAHQICNLVAVVLSVIFLITYVIYHAIAPETHYGGQGLIRYIYFFILITHILLSGIIIPFVLFTLLRAYQGDFPRHRKIARITWPMWFYVAVTGVLVYIMISPYY
ncbi:MAG: DUF420 domain-containing protein [Chitinophagaceae bacterium]